MKKSTPFCWKKDACEKEKCHFIHPRDSENAQSQRKPNKSARKYSFGSKSVSASSKFSHSTNSQSSHSHQKQSIESGSTSSTSHHLQNSEKALQKVTKGNNATSQVKSISKQPTQLQSLSQLESDTIEQHRFTIANIKDEISNILLSDDYSVNYEKQQANIRILQGNIIELESHILIFDSVKSRACRELSTKPHELYLQILREIYRLKCRLGAFGKRLDIEKHLTSGHRFLIIQGQTGSGKSTQIPQYLADHPRFYGKKIICTQPRKLAAISLARRVSFEYTGKIVNNDNEFSYIGYQVGGDKRKGKDCRIEFVTEGIMLERIMKGDINTFKNVGCIVVDEAHERSIVCDLLLGSFKKLDPRWNDILVIVTSATIDLNLFSEYFNDAPTVQIEGRTFPVDIIYQPVTNESEIQFAVAQCAFEIHQNCKSLPGDILCFLPGLEDLLNATLIFERKLKMVNRNSGLLEAKVFTLYGKQDPDKQAKVFETFDSTTTRKIIFATDVAETSITIDGVVYVVDSGVKKEIVFDPQRNISSLKINCISKSSAIQRAGRSGRTQPGICYRLYSQDEFESMNVNAAPEILCKPISLAVLTLLEMSTDPIEFDWISSPSKEAMANAEKELTILGAVDSNRKPTALGNLIAACQQDPKMMKIVYCGCLKGFGEAACTVAAILTVSSMFFWNGNDGESKAKALNQRKKLALPEGDIVTMYRIFEDWNSVYHGRKAHNSQTADKSEGSSVSNSKKMASVWCKDNSINGKSMFMALNTRAELLKQLRKTKIWQSVKSQNKLPTNLEVQEIMCSGYFTQSARVFYSKNVRASIEYFSVESEVAGRLDFRSTLKLLDIEAPKWIVYDKIVRLPNTIFPIASVMDDAWLKETNPDFYAMCLKKTESLPTHLIMKSISQVSFRMIVGKNFCNVDSLEKELGCLVTGDAETGQLYLYCALIKKDTVEQLIHSKIDVALKEIKKQVTEETYVGETRVVIGEGYKVHEILFENEFATLYIKNIPMDICKRTLKQILTIDNEDLASLDCVEQDNKYTAIAKFSSKKDTKVAYQRVLDIIVPETQITVSPGFGENKGVRHGLTCRLKLTWPTAKSKGIANILFHTPEGANNFLENAQYIYPDATIHVCGETLRSAQRKLLENRPNIVQPPLTYLKLGKYDRRCRFRFDLDAIDSMPDKQKLNYKVILNGLQPNIDKHKLTTTLNNYDPKNVIVEYEHFKTPDSGNGLTIEEKTVKLSPLSRFMKKDTRTSDFFYKNSGVAGICVFFTSNSTAKEAYNYAKPKYDSIMLQPHHLEIEYTHMISVQIGLFTFLKQQISVVQKEAQQKGISAVTTPLRNNSKFVIMRFHTSKHSLLTWIQEKLDELTRPTKFNCPNSEVLFTWTGRQQLMKLGKKAYVHWSDDSHVIWVYGNLEHKEKTCKEIETTAAHLKSLDILDQEIWLNKTVKINGKEGKNISTKCREEKLAFFHFHGNKFFISGSKKSVDAVVQYMEKNRYNSNRSKNQFKYEESRECGLCGMPPDETFIMLSVCEHLFCSDCIEPMVNMQPPPFPVTCPVCEQFVALHDIKKLAPTKSLEKVLELAVRKFQEDNSYHIRLCPNPGCSQLLSYEQRTTGTHGGDFLFCDECITTFCINCSDKMSKPIKSHENDSCDDVQNGVTHLVYKHVRTIQETVLNLSCPKCKTAFFDFNGCAAVSCSTCNAGFCGLCLAHCGTDAHSHVPSCSKNPTRGVFVDIKDINAANLQMRNEKLREYMQRNMTDVKLRNSVVRSIQKDLIDLGMDVPNILADSEYLDEASTEVSIEIVKHVRTIQETILTLSCPYCAAAFFDFDGCAAVTCDTCRTAFCGLCLRFCGANVLEHVSSCTRNPKQGNYFVNSNELPTIHAAVRSEKLAEYFQRNIADAKAKEKVLSIICRDVTDLKIELPRIDARPPIPARAVPIRQPPIFAHRRMPAAEPMRQQQPPVFAYHRMAEAEPMRQQQFPAFANRRISPVRPARQQPRRECCIL